MIHSRLRAAAGNRGSIPTDGLVAHYTMDNISGSTLVDEMGNFDGTIYNASQVAGAVGQALQFQGSTSSYVDIGNNFSFIQKTRNFALCFIFKVDDLSSDYRTLCGNSPVRTADAGVFASIRATGEMRFAITRGLAGQGPVIDFNTSGLSISTGVANRLVITGDDSVGVSVFINGAKHSTELYEAASTSSNDTRSLFLGACNDDGGAFPFPGYEDQVRIYNRPLTDAEAILVTEEGV